MCTARFTDLCVCWFCIVFLTIFVDYLRASMRYRPTVADEAYSMYCIPLHKVQNGTKGPGDQGVAVMRWDSGDYCLLDTEFYGWSFI